jgi:hypothetical protein
MVLGHLLSFVLMLCSSYVLAEAEDYDGTRIADRTIERVRRDNYGQPKTAC